MLVGGGGAEKRKSRDIRDNRDFKDMKRNSETDSSLVLGVPAVPYVPLTASLACRLLERATYEKIEDEEPYYGEIPGIQGVWATAKTLEECRRRLAQAFEDWVFFSVYLGEKYKKEATLSEPPQGSP